MRLVTCKTCQAKNENIGFEDDIGIFFNPYVLQHPVLVYLQSIKQLVNSSLMTLVLIKWQLIVMVGSATNKDCHTLDLNHRYPMV